jgi:hypothetical protein
MLAGKLLKRRVNWKRILSIISFVILAGVTSCTQPENQGLKQTMMALGVMQTVQAKDAEKTQQANIEYQQATLAALSVQATLIAIQPTPIPLPAPTQAPQVLEQEIVPAALATPVPTLTPVPTTVTLPMTKAVITGVKPYYCSDTGGTIQIWWKMIPAAVKYRICVKRGDAAGSYDKCTLDKVVDNAQPDPMRNNDLTYKVSLACRVALAVSVRGIDMTGYEGEWAADWRQSVPTPVRLKKTPTPILPIVP